MTSSESHKMSWEKKPVQCQFFGWTGKLAILLASDFSMLVSHDVLLASYIYDSEVTIGSVHA